MGLLTFAELKLEVLRSTGQSLSSLGTDGSEADGETRLERFLNQVLIELSQPTIYRHRVLQETFTQALVSGQAQYGTETGGRDTLAVDSVRIFKTTDPTRSRRLDPIRPRQQFETTLTNGIPQQYAIWGPQTATNDQLHLIPAPNAQTATDWTLEIRRIREVIPLAAAGDVAELEDAWDEVILQGARWKVFKHINSADRAELAKSEFGQLINELTDQVNYEARDTDFGPKVMLRPYM